MSCPCGTQVKSGQKSIAYVTDQILAALAAAAPGVPILAVIDPLYGRAINVTNLCATEPVKPLAMDTEWWIDPVGYLDQILAMVEACSWNTWCECSVCPPITSCTGGNSWVVNVADAQCDPTATVPPGDPCFPCQRWQYLLPGAATYYCARSDGTCFGPFTGLNINWTCPSFDPPNGRVKICNYNGTNCTLWDRATYGDAVRIYQGDGTGGAPVYNPDTGTITAEDPPGPPACDPTTVCTALTDIASRITVLERLQTIGLDTENQVNQALTLTLPDGTTLTGNLPVTLQAAIQALLPVIQSQLNTPTVTPFAGSGGMALADVAFLAIEFTAAPDWLTQRGGTVAEYATSWQYTGPGYMVFTGPTGVLEFHELRWPQGLMLPIPPLATGASFELAPGVEIAATTYKRSV